MIESRRMRWAGLVAHRRWEMHARLWLENVKG